MRGKKKKAGNTFVSSAFLSSLLSDSNQRPRDYKSRAQALEDSKGAGRIGLTRFRFAVAKVGIILKSAIACGDFFICFFRFSILSLFTAPYTDTLEGRYGFFPALRWTNIPFTKKYSSDMCNLIVRQLLNYRPTAVGR